MAKKSNKQLALPGVGRRGKPKTAVVRHHRKSKPGTGLMLYENARRALQAAATKDEVKDIHDKAAALSEYARRARDGDLVAYSTRIRDYAERELGIRMAAERAAGKLAKGTRGSKVKGARVDNTPTLADQGIDKQLADRARKAAALTDAKFKEKVEHDVDLAVAVIQGDSALVKAARARRQQEKQARRVQREQTTAQKIRTLPDKRYGVILADPPWGRTAYDDETGRDRDAGNHYMTANPDDSTINAMPVASIAAPDCVLFLWCTEPWRGAATLRAWGFEPKAYFVWVKDIIPVLERAEIPQPDMLVSGQHLMVCGPAGLGYWNRDRCEILLVGTVGKPVAPAQGTQGERVWFAKRGEHSAKPPNAHEWIERQFPSTPKVELFARSGRTDWDIWGAEAPAQTNGGASTVVQFPAPVTHVSAFEDETPPPPQAA